MISLTPQFSLELCQVMEFNGASYQEWSKQLQQELVEGLDALKESLTATREDRFCLHKVCFNKLVDFHSAYKPLLSKIKAEYEECVEAIEKAPKEVAYLSDKLASAVTQPFTLRNYNNRVDELQEKICILKSDNQRLLLKVDAMRCNDEDKQEENAHSSVIGSASEIPSPQNMMSSIPSLTLEQQTDVDFLIKKLAWLKTTVKRLNVKQNERFVMKELKDDLLNRLRLREDYKGQLAERREQLKLRAVAVKVAVGTERNKRSNISSRRRESAFVTLASAFKQTIEDVNKAGEIPEENTEVTPIEEHDLGPKIGPETKPQEGDNIQIQEDLFSFPESDDPKRDREAKFILEYIEHFDQLVKAGKLEEAALVAAHSPKGVLRTQETFQTFKEQDAKRPRGSQSLLLGYWEAVLATVLVGCQKPSKWESLACTRCALEQGRPDLLAHWIAQDQMTETCELGAEVLAFCRCVDSCTCGLNALAQLVYENVGNYEESIKCLLRQGRFYRALKYGLTQPQVKSKDIIKALLNFPEKTGELLKRSSTPEEVFSAIFTVEEIISLLINLDNEYVDVEDVQGVIRRAVDQGHRFQVTALIESDVYDVIREKSHKWTRLYHLFKDLGHFNLAESLFAYNLVTDVVREAWRVYMEIFVEFL